MIRVGLSYVVLVRLVLILGRIFLFVILCGVCGLVEVGLGFSCVVKSIELNIFIIQNKVVIL